MKILYENLVEIVGNIRLIFITVWHCFFSMHHNI